MYLEPSAPPLTELLKDEDVHYNCESGCDVEILVGKTKDDLMRIPVHSCKLRVFPVFAAMLSEKYYHTEKVQNGNGYSKLKQISVSNVDGKAFDNLMKFIYKKPVNLQSPEMAIETLKAAHEFLLPELVFACVKQLHQMISLSNVLFIFASVRYLCNDLENLEDLTRNVCVALPKRTHNDHLSAGLEVKNFCVWLLCQCLAFIDVHGAKVLESDEMEELDRPYVAFLLKRDSLDVCETAVFSAIVRWAETECKRQHLPLTPESKRKVLHDLIYFVRYFQMAPWEFQTGPEESGLLKQSEVELIKNVIARRTSPRRFSCSSTTCCTKVKQNNLSEPNNNNDELNQLKAHWNYFSQPRCNRLSKEVGDKRKKSWNAQQFRFRKVGFLIKRICLPCAYGNKHQSSHESEQIMMIKKKEKELARAACARKESSYSTVFDYSLRVFAFFFD
ncbi:unnamed protein product [Orchesella dallaii]|uniref:BTB domain-containing protein n=1 Tax=Orchesella dallaii TaxID=48710 RepID=A0ABP1RBL9_9HEXA